MAGRMFAGMFYQYLGCDLLTTIYFVLTERTATPAIVFLGAIGFLMALGNYCQWRAVKSSLSKTALYFSLVDVTAIALAFVFIGERGYWTLSHSQGIILCFLSVGIFNWANSKGNKDRKENQRDWVIWVLLMAVIFGSGSFLMKYFSFSVSLGTFMFAWFNGTFLGSLSMVLVKGERLGSVSKADLAAIAPLSIASVGSMGLLYLTYQLGGPVSFVSPLMGWASTVIPMLAGWLLFGEAADLFVEEYRYAFVVGLVGAFLILF